MEARIFQVSENTQKCTLLFSVGKKKKRFQIKIIARKYKTRGIRFSSIT